MSTELEPRTTDRPEQDTGQPLVHRTIYTPVRRPQIQPARPVFPNWGITAIAVFFLSCLLIVGIVISEQYGVKQAGTQPTIAAAPASTGSSNSSSMPAATSTSDTSATATPATGPTVAHQTYNPKAPAALQGSTVNVTLTVKELLLPIAPGVVYHAWTFGGTVPG